MQGRKQAPVLMLPLDELPAEFIHFLSANDIPASIYYAKGTCRYVTLTGASEQFHHEYPHARPITWLPGTYSIACNESQSKTPIIKDSSSCCWLFMDAASVLAVQILDPQPGDHVLDLCCAPGMKLSLIGQLVGTNGSITGVDISKQRLAICRSLVKKHRVPRCRLFCADGRTFDGRPLRLARGHVIRPAVSDGDKAFFSSTAFRRFPHDVATGYGESTIMYDRVLVDAQCTHDGSIKHIQKADARTWECLRRQFDPSDLADLHTLQYSLLQNGFRLCRPGGILVYSTCSYSRAQNEDIVSRFVSLNPSARLCALSVPGLFDQEQAFLRIDPRLHKSGFLFIAKLIKIA